MWVKCLNLKRRRISPSLLELCLEFLHSRGKACRILDCLSAGEISRALSDLVLRSASPLQLAYFESEFPNLVAELEEVDHWNWRDLIRGWMQEIVANCWTQNSGRNEFVEVIKLHFIRVNLSLKDCQVWENSKWENEMKILFDAIHGVNDEVDDTQYVLKILHCVAKICSRQVTSLALPMKRLENSILEQFMPLIKKLKKLTTIKLDFYNSLGTNASQESLSLLRNLSLEIARSRDSSLKELHLRGKILDSKSNDTLLSIFDPEIYACWETVDFAIDSIVHELDIKSSPFEGESSMKKLAVHESFLPITHLQHCKIFQGIKYLELSNYVFPEKHTEAILNLLESSDLTEFTLHDIHFERNLTFELMLVSLLKAKNLLKIHFDAVEVYNFMQIDWELLFRNQQGLDELIISRMWQNSSFNLYHEILKSGEKIPCSHVGNRNLRPNRKLGHFALNRGFIEPEYLVYLYKFPCDHLDLSYNSLFSRFKDVHLNNMIQCTKVNHLDLSGNRLGSLNLSLFEATWNILISSECLQHLVLQNNLIHSKHLKILVSGLRVRNSRFQKLQVLDLRENFLTYIDLNSTSSSENLNAFPKISDLVESLFLNTERVLVPVSDCLSQTSWAEVQTMSRMS